MRLILILAIVSLWTYTNCQVIQRIAFGSCSNQNKDQSILLNVVDEDPDLFIYLGDNIYADTKDMDVMKAKYDKLGKKEEHQMLRAHCEVLATWDDHDYGKNDAGKEYKRKTESKNVFLDFWEEPLDSERYNHNGIYHSKIYESENGTLQVILLDTRTFRDKLKKTGLRRIKFKNQYQPNFNESATFLGAEQWSWLETQFKMTADIRIIASSNQFAHEYNGYESWRNLPIEQQKMLDLINKTKAEGVIFISGDVHYGELSVLESPDAYSLYDVTSSGLTQTWGHTEKNENRVGEVVPENNFGLISIDWVNQIVSFNLYDKEELRVNHSVDFSDLQFK